MLRSCVLLSLFAALATSVAADRDLVNDCFDIKGDENRCNKSRDKVSNCIWCVCQAVPSVCVNYEQARSLPPGVFVCPEIPDDFTSSTRRENPFETLRTREGLETQGDIDITYDDIEEDYGNEPCDHGEDEEDL